MTPDPSFAPAHSHADELEEDGRFELAKLRDYASFAARCLRRRALSALGIAAAVIIATMLLLRILPRTYRVDTTIVVQADLLLSALATGRADQSGSTQGIGDIVLARRNLISLIQQTNLVERWKLTRAPLYRLKDALYASFMGPITDDQLVDALIYLLEKRLVAWSDDRKVTIEVAWSDPGDAYRIAAATQQNFLESRQLAETSAITDTITILESHLATARQHVDAAVANARALRPRDAIRAPAKPADASEVQGRASLPAGVSPETLRLRGQLEGRQRAVEDLEQLRRRRLGELQAQYTEQKAVYAGSHPILVNLRESIEALNQDSPQLAQLRREAHELEAEYIAKGGKLNAPEAEASQIAPTSPPPSVILRETSRDPREEYSRLELANAMSQYNALLDRVYSARLELDTARASFKYRYLIVRPPLPPKVAVRPNVRMLATAGVLAGLLSGVLAALGLELRKGLVVQAWQVERSLGVPLLAELPASVIDADPVQPPATA